VNAIFQSTDTVPSELRSIFQRIRMVANEKFSLEKKYAQARRCVTTKICTSGLWAALKRIVLV
jgi:hypothetical protein